MFPSFRRLKQDADFRPADGSMRHRIFLTNYNFYVIFAIYKFAITNIHIVYRSSPTAYFSK